MYLRRDRLTLLLSGGSVALLVRCVLVVNQKHPVRFAALSVYYAQRQVAWLIAVAVTLLVRFCFWSFGVRCWIGLVCSLRRSTRDATHTAWKLFFLRLLGADENDVPN